MLTRILCLLVLTASVAAMPACQTSPATGETQFNVLSPQEEVEIGEQAAPQFVDQLGGEVPSRQVQAYVSSLGRELAAVSERPDLPWEFTVVDSETVNAFALPGGKIFISRGMLARLNNEAQLAGILGHEIGHVTDQHIGQQMSWQMARELGLGVAGATIQSEEAWADLLVQGLDVGSGIGLLGFSRGQEMAADRLGLRYMSELGYNPVALVEVMQILKEASRSGTIEFLSTHPLPETRIEEIYDIVRERYPDYEEVGRYRFDEAGYEANILAEMQKLPPPEHRQEGARG
ncbi:MAG: M48 family metalloprotease [Phycisphaeraceae bacterium]